METEAAGQSDVCSGKLRIEEQKKKAEEAGSQQNYRKMVLKFGMVFYFFMLGGVHL